MAHLEFIAFINKERATKLGLKLEDIVTPYALWYDDTLGVTFPKPRGTYEREKLERSDRFIKYNTDSNYQKKEVYCPH